MYDNILKQSNSKDSLPLSNQKSKLVSNGSTQSNFTKKSSHAAIIIKKYQIKLRSKGNSQENQKNMPEMSSNENTSRK